MTILDKFRLDGKEFWKVEELVATIKERRRVADQDEDIFLVGRVHPLPATRFQLVVSAVDAFARAGMEKVDLKQ